MPPLGLPSPKPLNEGRNSKILYIFFWFSSPSSTKCVSQRLHISYHFTFLYCLTLLVSNTGVQRKLVCLNGTIPVNYKGMSLSLFMGFCTLMLKYPEVPLLYIISTFCWLDLYSVTNKQDIMKCSHIKTLYR